MRTVYCICCVREKAHLYSGHVLKEGKKISAGFCRSQCHFEMDKKVKPLAGCFGPWKEEYGLRN
jgi:hypothetical protein